MKLIKFWKPESGVTGGAIVGTLISIVIIAVMPPIIKLVSWWFSLWF